MAVILQYLRSPRAPWLSLGLGAAVLAVATLAPESAALLLADREGLARGELWRLWSGHAVHFGVRHLAWDLGAFLVAGIWLERIARGRLGILLLTLPPLICLSLFAACPGLGTYGGLSGLNMALLAALAIALARGGRPLPALGIALVVLGRIAADALGGAGLAAGLGGAFPRAIWEAHSLGAMLGTAAGLALFLPRKKPSSKPLETRTL